LAMPKKKKGRMRVVRSLGVDLWGSGLLTEGKAPPGQHGSSGRKKLTGYGSQFLEVRKLKNYYDIGERTFRRIYSSAVRKKGDASENLVASLESLFASIVYHAKLAPTIYAARQLISHKHFLINGKSVNISTCVLRAGDIITVVDKSRDVRIIKDAHLHNSRDVPGYISVNYDELSARFIKIPTMEEVRYPVPIAIGHVVEFYSRKI